FPEFVEFKARSGTRTTVRERAATVAVESDDEETPLERVAAAVRQLDSSTGADLVERLRSQPPEFLEKAVLDVPGQHVVDSRVGRRPPRLVVSNVTEVEAFSWSTVMRGSLSRAV